jgi:hypothetical protein
MKPGDFGVSIYYGRNPMKKKCNDCPFLKAGQGQDYLAPGRLDGIKFAVTMGQSFYCHKTIYSGKVPLRTDPETGEEIRPHWHPTYRMCRGATEYAEQLAKDLNIEPLRIGSTT